MDDLGNILNRLESCVRRETYESLETDWLEVKPVPATGNAWNSIRESICAFLNTRGGVVLLGLKDEQKPNRRYVFSGYTEDQSGQLSDLRNHFKDARRNPMDIGEFIRFEVRPFMDGQVALVRVSALPEDRKFSLFREVAYERVADRDEQIAKTRVDDQEERKQEMETYRELRPVEGVTLDDLSLQRINELIFLINQGQDRQIESLKSTLSDAVPFLERRRFLLKDGQVTTLGMLVVGSHPEEHLVFRSHLDAFVAVPNLVAQDKKTFRDNILQLMEAGHNWTLRNIQTGVSHEAGGTAVPEYPEKLIRECINNALAHRDYSINRPVQLTLKPRESLEIRNPGHLPHELVFEKPDDKVAVRRIFPNPKARNPRLADVLKLHSKWEGMGIGMSDLVNFTLANKIDLPYYLFHSAEELSLCIPSGKLLDESMEEWIELMDGLVSEKTQNRPLTHEHRMVLAYLLKSERNNRLGRYTLALTPSNNHFEAITNLKSWGLIELHPASDQFREVYVVCRSLAEDDHYAEIRELMGADFDRMDEMSRLTLNMISIAERYSKQGGLNAKQVFRLIRHRMPDELRKRGEDEFYRAVRYRVERMAPDKTNRPSDDLFDSRWHSVPERILSVRGPSNRPTFRLNRGFHKPML
jgi:ATP-dependent DNA helicase RecG